MHMPDTYVMTKCLNKVTYLLHERALEVNQPGTSKKNILQWRPLAVALIAYCGKPCQLNQLSLESMHGHFFLTVLRTQME